MLNFHIVLPLIEPLADSFSKTCTLTSRKYVSKLGMRIYNLPERFDFFYRIPPYLLCKFSDLFTSKRVFGGYLQQGAYTHFQEIGS